MSEPERKILFVNQSRITPRCETFDDAWYDECDGHEDLYHAIECGEHKRGLLSGVIKPECEHEAEWAADGRDIAASGHKIAWRIVRRTMVDELIEESV